MQALTREELAYTSATMGAALLDLEGPPNWDEEIDERKLDGCHFIRCPLGQLFGTYQHGIEALNLDVAEEYTYGFNGHDPKIITEAWRRVLRERRSTS
ncbi:MAG TPA: hypothetical protein VD928_04010 [Candidatus Paceibacterota bacterium]|nr:hypothetical protein [Candidatus Paceibacterota bacterium]